jgi:hypothetical protein
MPATRKRQRASVSQRLRDAVEPWRQPPSRAKRTPDSVFSSRYDETWETRDALVNSRSVGYFMAIYRYGSFTDAARACGVSQPAITVAVKRLEFAVGGRLFERGPPLALTRLGLQLLPLIDAAQRASDRISSFLIRRMSRRAR